MNNPTTLEETEAPPPDDLVAATVRDIKALQWEHGLALACEIGRLIVNRFYRGDVSLLRQRGPKAASLRSLAEHPELPMSPSSLYRAVAIFEVVERTGGLERHHGLGPCHFRAVLPLSDDDQARLLERASEEGWTAEQLDERVRALRVTSSGTARTRGGRPRLPRVVKTARKLARLTEDDEALGDIELLSSSDAQQVMEVVRRLRHLCIELEDSLSQRAFDQAAERIGGGGVEDERA